jgi:glycosyltransferase involved in cell wall biosynthesis
MLASGVFFPGLTTGAFRVIGVGRFHTNIVMIDGSRLSRGLAEPNSPQGVLVLIPTLDVGGAEMDLLRILPRIDRNRFKIVVYTFLARGTLADRLTAAGIEIVVSFSDFRRVGRATLRLARKAALLMPDKLHQVGSRASQAVCNALLPQLERLAGMLPRRVFMVPTGIVALMGYTVIGIGLIPQIRARRISVIHAVLPNSYLIGSLANTLTGLRSLVMSRVGFNSYHQNRLCAWVERKLCHPRMTAAVSNCGAIIRELAGEGISGNKLHLVHNGIDIADFRGQMTGRENARNLLKLPRDAFVISVVANLHEYKGHADILGALNSLPQDAPEWFLLAAGRDIRGSRERLEALSRQFGFSHRVRFLGHRDDIPTILSAADIHVSGSHTEGLPNNILEAMCAGLPVVATDAGGVRELVVDQQTGVLVTVRDAIGLGQAIYRLALDEPARRSMGEAGLKRVEQNFPIGKAVEAFSRIYGQMSEAHSELEVARKAADASRTSIDIYSS